MNNIKLRNFANHGKITQLKQKDLIQIRGGDGGDPPPPPPPPPPPGDDDL